MADSEKKDDAVPVPAWQQQQNAIEHSSDSTTSPPPVATLDHARLFLQDDEVRNASRDKKVNFLRSKGVSDADIESLLGEDESNTSDSSQATAVALQPTQEQSQPHVQQPQQHQQAQAQPLPQQIQSAQKPDQPPIVTYPEFLAKPPRPPPLITATTFLNTASIFAGLATLIIGTSKFVLAPMAESLTDARVDLHRSAADGLDRTVDKLEAVVSEVPPVVFGRGKKNGLNDDHQDHDAASTSSSGDSDPTELFHRDVGVQTSPPQTPSATAITSPSAIESQATRLAKLTASLREVSTNYITQAEANESTRAVLSDLAADIDKLRVPAALRPAGAAYYRSFSEPDDQVKVVKQSIRSVKGVLLSARSFPPPQGSVVR